MQYFLITSTYVSASVRRHAIISDIRIPNRPVGWSCVSTNNVNMYPLYDYEQMIIGKKTTHIKLRFCHWGIVLADFLSLLFSSLLFNAFYQSSRHAAFCRRFYFFSLKHTCTSTRIYSHKVSHAYLYKKAYSPGLRKSPFTNVLARSRFFLPKHKKSYEHRAGLFTVRGRTKLCSTAGEMDPFVSAFHMSGVRWLD